MSLSSTGYDGGMVHRYDLYNFLLSQVPAEKISLNSRVIDIEQNDHGVTIRTSNNETHHGDILVGADGVNSAVRTKLFEQLAKENKLPASDTKGLEVGSVCLVGTTKPLDPEKYPILKNGKCHFMNFIGENGIHTVSLG